MKRGVRWYLVGSAGLLVLAGCGKSILQYAEREPWRREAEVACLNSGTIKEGSSLVRIDPIDGPGVCGAAFPIKVTALGDNAIYGYAEEVVRPPGAIPGGQRPVAGPRWPIQQQPYDAPSRAAPIYSTPADGPMSLEPPGAMRAPAIESRDMPPPEAYPQQRQLGAPPAYLRAPSDWRRNSDPPPVVYAPAQPRRGAPQPAAEPEYDEELPPYARPGAPPLPPAVRQQQPLPRLGPERSPQVIAASTPIEIRPAATLACPIVSALDRWFATSVQPAARKWFNQPVVEIKQISAYSCRGMNGQVGARISEHAFGNALDIAAFVLADGHRVTVKGGWRGTPEEQGFLRDVQASACDQFTTVLAPGSNAFHYDHIHVDLMRRGSGRRICQPGAVDGELVAARARRGPAYASRQPEPPPTRRYDPPVAGQDDPFAWRGDARRGDITGTVAARRPGVVNPAAEDNDWVEEPGPRPAIDWSSDRHNVR